MLLICNLLLGATHFALLLYALRAFCSRRVTFGVGAVVYTLGTLLPGAVVGLPAGLPRTILTALHYILPQFRLYQSAPTPDLLLVNATYFTVWAGHLLFCRQLCLEGKP